MRIALVSTWGTHCGIATYSERLGSALVAEGHDVVAFAPNEPGTGMRRVPGINCLPLWDRFNRGLAVGAGNAESLASAVKQNKIDVVHFQHEAGLFFSGDGFVRSIRACRAAGAAVAVTFHTVWPYGSALSRTGLFDDCRKHADLIIAHTLESWAALSLARGDAKVVRVSHGSHSDRKGNPNKGRELLEVQQYGDVPIALAFGFLSRGKNVVGTIRTFAEAWSRRLMSTKVLLVIAGENKDDTYTQHAIPTAITMCGYETNIQCRIGFYDSAKIPDLMAAASFGVLNTAGRTLSASGQVHEYASHDVPLVVANRPIYSEAIEYGALSFPVSDADSEGPTLEAVNAVAAMVRLPELRRQIGARMSQLAAATKWSSIAKQYTQLYTEICGGKSTLGISDSQ